MLNRLVNLEQDITTAVIGIGSIGKGLVYQIHTTPGMACVAISDIKIERAISCAEWLGIPYATVGDLNSMHDAVRRGVMAVCEDGALLSSCEGVDVMIEASNSITEAGRYAAAALQHGAHVVMMNTEADLIFGPYLLSLARKHGRVYTGCDGDQPAVIARIVNDMRFWGFDLVMAGNIKGYLDRYINPTTIMPEADKRNLDYHMCTSYTDGTKLAIEMAVLANALGLRTSVPGMHGPRAKEVHDVFDLMDLEAIWADRQPVVDYILGAQPTGGVFAIGYTDNEFQQFTLDWFPPRMGPGPFYLFYRPYHLGHIEALACVADAALDGRAILQPEFGFQTNVYTYAKRDVAEGEVLDGIGGYLCYGLIENHAGNTGLPICLSNGVRLRKPVSKDQKINMDDVEYDSDRPDFVMYRQALESAAS